ncbi:acyl-CoA/acyl-ACP dehydrogenase [Sphingobium sp. JS3065]|uniref:acyl-CoA dehydrogenase family protein n=1 Tax=Sphingobium sp. JS3065 TaxID=2970925 RepID=UPI002264E0B7|nr:acyl-CoA dehydrogenase family protein [Sphingobium sp. JS3065]UZW57518.1 acyl-CoA/acyl-ACP dehydrogenase [Sphingobium sp. JS3065]
MQSSPFADPSRIMVDHMLGDNHIAYRQRLDECLEDAGVTGSGSVLGRAAATGLLAGQDGDLLKLALVAEASAGRPALQCLASDRYSLLASMFGSVEQKSVIFAPSPPMQALCIADRALVIEAAPDGFVASGTIHSVRAAANAEWLYLALFEEGGRACYLVSAASRGVNRKNAIATGSADVELDRVSLTPGQRLTAKPEELDRLLAVIGLFDGLEALAAGQRLCDESVATAKSRPAGSATGFDDQDVQFRLASAQARLMIASGYRTAIFRDLMSERIDPFRAAVAKLWLSECAEEVARVSVMAGLGPRNGTSEVITTMLADAMRGNLLRDLVAEQF